MVSVEMYSRNYEVRPGDYLHDGIAIEGWDEQSYWGYSAREGSFFAQLWPNGSTADEPRIGLSGIRTVYPWPGSIVLELMERLDRDPVEIVRALGLAHPRARLRSAAEITQRLKHLAEHEDPHKPYTAGRFSALGWIQGLTDITPASRRPWQRGTRPSPSQVDAEHHVVTGRVYRDHAREFYSGADEMIFWALGRCD